MKLPIKGDYISINRKGWQSGEENTTKEEKSKSLPDTSSLFDDIITKNVGKDTPHERDEDDIVKYHAVADECQKLL